jgi:y4mF family transcriptional regulator
MHISAYLKEQRKRNNLTQVELATKSGVGLRLVREIEQGKTSMRMDKVNQILALFGGELAVVSKANQHN